MNRRIIVAGLGLALAPLALLNGCDTAPKSQSARDSLSSSVQAALENFKRDDPSLDALLSRSAGYAVFPEIGKGGAIVGGAYGKGEFFEGGRLTGYCDVSQATVGLQLGGQTYSQLVVFENADAVTRFKTGKLNFSANASAVAIKSGAGAAAKYTEGVAIFVRTTGGLMGEASVGGQQFTFQAIQ